MPTTPWVPASYNTSCAVTDISPGYGGSTRAAQLSCDNTLNDDSVISQNLATCAGVKYDLSFYYKIIYGQAEGSYVQITVFDTPSSKILCQQNLENYCAPGTVPMVDGYGNIEGDWYQANKTVAPGFGQITALSSTTTVQILLRSGFSGQQTLYIAFDNVAFQAIVPTGATIVGQ